VGVGATVAVGAIVAVGTIGVADTSVAMAGATVGEGTLVAVALAVAGVAAAVGVVAAATALVAVDAADSAVGAAVGEAAPPHAERVSNKESSNAPSTPPRRAGFQFRVIGISSFVSLGASNTTALLSIIPYLATAEKCVRSAGRPL